MSSDNQLLSQEYWNDRAVILSESLLEKGDVYYSRLSIEYERAISRIEKEIESFYTRFAKENKVSFSEAKRLLTSQESKRFALDINEYIEKGKTLNYTQEWAHQLENAGIAHRVTRLSYIQMQMRQQVEELHSKYNVGLSETLTQAYNEGYYRNIFDTFKAHGQGAPFATLDTEKVKTIINKPWAPDGSNFSEKIWKDREGLVNYMNKELAQAFIRGENADRLIKDIKKKFNVSSQNAARLVQTEMAFFSAMSKLQSYKELGYKKYIIVAVMDAKTSQICRDMDGEVFNIDDFAPGATANPFHPRCRTTTAPYVGTGEKKDSAGMMKDAETGKMYTIPQDMTYKEWREKYVDGNILSSSGTDKPDDIPENEPVFVEKITPDMIDKKLLEYENEIKDSKTEIAYVITEAGGVYKVYGNESFVTIADLPFENSIITHNHPLDDFGDADSFSMDDLAFYNDRPEIKELRAVNKFYRYRLNLLKRIDIPYNEVYINGLDKAYKAGVMDENQHYAMEYLKEMGYIDYKRYRIDP